VSVADARMERGRRGGAAAIGSGARLFLRRLRFDAAAPVAMFLLVGATCYLLAALPRLANSSADDGLRYMVSHAASAERNVRVVETDRLPASRGGDPRAAVADRAARSRQSLPPVLRRSVASSTFVIRSPRHILQRDVRATAPAQGPATPGPAPHGLTRYLTIRAQSGVASHLRVVAGRLPRPSDVRVRARVTHLVFYSVFFRQVSEVSWATNVPVVQVALSTTTARLLGLHVGDREVFTPDLTELAVQRVPLRELKPLAVEVVGLFVVKNPRAAFWFGDPTLGTPDVRQSVDLERREVFGQALVSPGQYAGMLAATAPLPLTYEYRHFVDPDRFDAGRLPALRDAVGHLESRFAGAGPLDRRVEVGLGPVLARYSAARSQAETLLAVAAIGLVGCALANIGLLGALWYERRRGETAVSRARGASSLQVLAVQVAEGVLIAAPAGLAGWTAAELTVGARTSNLSAWLVAGLVAATIVLVVAAIAGAARRPLGIAGREDIVLARPSPRRLALEGLVAVAAALGVYLLRRRGLESSSSEAGGFDPYLAGVPVLLGLACGIVALRLYPLPVAGAARLARRARGLALHLGLSRAARQPDITSAPLLVLVLALGIACFAIAMLATLDAGQNRAAWRAVGADVRVDAPEGGALPPVLISRLAASGDVARAYVQDAGAGEVGQATLLIALELDAYQRLVAGTPAAVTLPAELRRPPIPGLVPALVSTDWPSPGTFQVTLPHQALNLFTIGNRASFSGVPAGTPFAVVPLDALEQAAGEPIPPNRLYLRGVSSGDVREAVADLAPRAEIGSRAAAVSRLRASPLVANVFRGFRAAIVLAALYAAVAVGLMALIAARSRSRDLALVRTMGASPRQALVAAAVELAPFVATALLVGIGLGIAIPYLIEPGLDLAFFTGNDSSAIVLPWLGPAAAAGGLLVLVAVAIFVVGLRARRAGLDRVLRVGER
jgi:putative ABC transport system permease protein